MPNRLATETSPYLLQHKDNPVDWWPWCDEALAAARAQNKPIVLSVGYSACHWCHVMEHESFEDADVAAQMNADFISIKVDREERPDLDHIYMTACTLFTGSGGWPLTVFLTPALDPFFAGTYFPKEDRHGRPGFKRVLKQLALAWKEQREDVDDQAGKFRAALEGLSEAPKAGHATLDATTLTRATTAILRRFDAENGGFGNAPKFPHTMDLVVLESAARRSHAQAGHASVHTLEKMGRGGIHDHIGGGFHRYSTDEAWRVPHFEKMLYDNALLPRPLLAAHRRTGLPVLAEHTRGILRWAQREMTSAEGAFHATQDADSEGKEGLFFCWTPEQISAVLPPEEAARFCERFGVTRTGNFTIEDHSHKGNGPRATVLNIVKPDVAASENAMALVFAAREKRVKPARDDKVIASWNGLMASAFCDAAATLCSEAYLSAAVKSLDVVLTRMKRPDGGLFRILAGGSARVPAPLEDHAFVALALCDAYRAGAGVRFLMEAVKLCDVMLERFHDATDPGFFATERGPTDLIVRARSTHDDAVPSAASVACAALVHVGAVTGVQKYNQVVDAILGRHAADISAHPTAYASMVGVLDTVLRGAPTVVVSEGEGRKELLALVRRKTDADVAVVDAAESRGIAGASVLEGKGPVGGRSVAYVCANNTCQSPVADENGLKDALTRSGLHCSVV